MKKMYLLMSVLLLVGVCMPVGQAAEVCPHDSWKDGVCVECGAEPTSYEELLPDKYYKECPRQGTVEEYEYTPPIYYREGGRFRYQRNILIYVPYGCGKDEDIKYNVMVLLPGNDSAPRLWLTYPSDPKMLDVNGKMIIDNLIYYGDIEPTIFIALPTPDGFTDRWAIQYTNELQRDVLPMICEKYPTYAEDATLEGIQAARDHFGIGGCSNGGIYAYAIGLLYCKELFGNVMSLSAFCVPRNVVEEVAKGDTDNAVHMLYIGSGSREGNTKKCKAQYEQLLGVCSWLEDGRNAFYRTSIGPHNWRVWRTQMAMAMQLMF